MRFFKKILSGVLVLSLFCLYFPKIGIAGQSRLIAKANTAAPITKHKPEILSLPEKDIPFEEGEKNKWGRYVLAGVAVVGLIVLVAAAAGGGGGGGGNGNGPETGDVKVSW